MSDVRTIPFGSKHTPHQTLIDAMRVSETAKMIVIVVLDADDYVLTSWSDGSMLTRVGMLDIAKLRMIDAAEDA